MKGGDSKCYRIWISPSLVANFKLDERLSAISSFLKLNKKELVYFVDFEYIHNALRDTSATSYPGVRMDWVDGRPLGDYLKDGNKGANIPPTRQDISRLATEFLNMCRIFKKHKMAHGDLSSKNMLVDRNGRIRLVDYDSLYVPGLGTRAYQTTSGTPGFQHFQRLNSKEKLYASPNDDNFSQQVIYLSLLAIANSEVVYNQRKTLIDNELMFASVDMESVSAFKNSRAYKLIRKEFAPNSLECKLLDELSNSIAGPVSKVRPVVDVVGSVVDVSSIVSSLHANIKASYCVNCGQKFGSAAAKFCIRCGAKRLERSPN